MDILERSHRCLSLGPTDNFRLHRVTLTTHCPVHGQSTPGSGLVWRDHWTSLWTETITAGVRWTPSDSGQLTITAHSVPGPPVQAAPLTTSPRAAGVIVGDAGA